MIKHQAIADIPMPDAIAQLETADGLEELRQGGNTIFVCNFVRWRLHNYILRVFIRRHVDATNDYAKKAIDQYERAAIGQSRNPPKDVDEEADTGLMEFILSMRFSDALVMPKAFVTVYDILSWREIWSRFLCTAFYVIALAFSALTLLTGVWWVIELMIWGHAAR